MLHLERPPTNAQTGGRLPLDLYYAAIEMGAEGSGAVVYAAGLTEASHINRAGVIC